MMCVCLSGYLCRNRTYFEDVQKWMRYFQPFSRLPRCGQGVREGDVGKRRPSGQVALLRHRHGQRARLRRRRHVRPLGLSRRVKALGSSHDWQHQTSFWEKTYKTDMVKKFLLSSYFIFHIFLSLFLTRFFIRSFFLSLTRFLIIFVSFSLSLSLSPSLAVIFSFLLVFLFSFFLTSLCSLFLYSLTSGFLSLSVPFNFCLEALVEE